MNGEALRVLRMLDKAGEASLEEVSALLPKRHGDHRDFYILSSLVSAGMIDDEMMEDDRKPNPNRHKEMLLARKYYACSAADKKASFGNLSWVIYGDGETLKGQKFALSGKGSLYLSEIRSKRLDRVFTLSAGIIVGTFVAVASGYIKSLIGG